MAFPPIDYLSWAQRHYPGVEYDLASSGLRAMPSAELGPPPFPVDDASVWQRYRDAVGARFGEDPASVVPSLGASGGIFLTYAALFERGDEILLEQPSYEPMLRVAEGQGLRVRRFERRADQGYAVDPDAIARLLTPATRAVVLTDLHNPSGVAADHNALAAVASRLAKQGAYLLVDEVYSEIAGAGRTARKLGPNVVAFGSLTKCYGVWWPRCGYVLCPPEVKAKAERVLLHVCGAMPTTVAAYGAHALAQIDALEARRARLQSGKRPLIDAFMARHAGVLSWHPPHQGSLFGFVRDARGRDLRPALEAGAREEGVLAAAGSFFDQPSGFRLGWSLPADRLPEALARLERALGLV